MLELDVVVGDSHRSVFAVSHDDLTKNVLVVVKLIHGIAHEKERPTILEQLTKTVDVLAERFAGEKNIRNFLDTLGSDAVVIPNHIGPAGDEVLPQLVTGDDDGDFLGGSLDDVVFVIHNGDEYDRVLEKVKEFFVD